MPLEQMRREALDQRCDEWALASITYEMIAGENPFWARSMAEAERVIEGAELVLPSLCMDGIDQAADDALFYALDPDREERYPTVAEFADELEPCLGDARRGQKKLAKIVGRALADDDEEKEEEPAREPLEPWRLLDHVPVVPWDGVVRAFSAVGATALSWLALENVPQVGGVASPAFWGALAAVAVVGALVPHVGAAVGLALLAAALFLHAAPVPALVVVLGGVVWWWDVRAAWQRAGGGASDTHLGGRGVVRARDAVHRGRHDAPALRRRGRRVGVRAGRGLGGLRLAGAHRVGRALVRRARR